MFVPSCHSIVLGKSASQPLVRAKVTPTREIREDFTQAMSQPVGKLELLEQLRHVQKLYGQRLVVFLRALRDIEDPAALRLAECIGAAASHNEQWERFFSNDGNYPKLADEMWDVEHAQQVHQPLITLMLSEPVSHCVFQAGLEIDQIVEKHNAAVFGQDYRNYFVLPMFPMFITDHFFHLLKILEAYDRLERTPIVEDVRQFILWLDEQLRSLS